jgi:hypothetical protein
MINSTSAISREASTAPDDARRSAASTAASAVCTVAAGSSVPQPTTATRSATRLCKVVLQAVRQRNGF